MSYHPRDHQQEDIASILKEWESVRSTLYVAATGLGKTEVAVSVAERRLPLRTLFLAHRSELIWQARDAFLRRGMEVEVEKGELSASNNLFSRSPVVVATVQTLGSGEPETKRMRRFNPMDFGTLIYDESHHAVSVGNKKIVDYFVQGNPALRVLGLTASPDRLDEVSLGQIFESVASERDLLFGVDNGWLVLPHQKFAHIGPLDLSHIKTEDGDLCLSQLAEVMEAEQVVAGVVQPTLETMFGLPENTLSNVDPKDWPSHLKGTPLRTIIFTVSVKQSEQLSNILNRVIPGLASWVCGKTPDDQRLEIFRNFGSGQCHVLVNCNVATEGYDNPEVQLIVDAAPTKSRAKYGQRVGRSTRVLKGVVDGLLTKQERLLAIALSRKPKSTVLDICGNSGHHKLICLADLLGGRVSEEAVERAAKKSKQAGGETNMLKLLDEEEEKLRQEAKQARLDEEARRARLVARVKYTTTNVDPFDAFDMHPVRQRGWNQAKQLSPKVQEMLIRQKIDPTKLSYDQGIALCREQFRRWHNELCTFRQAGILKQHGYDTRNLKKVDASKLLDALKQNGWRRPDFNDVAKGFK